MVKHSVEAIKAILNPIVKVLGRPQFRSLYNLVQQLSYKLRKVNYPIYTDDGY